MAVAAPKEGVAPNVEPLWTPPNAGADAAAPNPVVGVDVAPPNNEEVPAAPDCAPAPNPELPKPPLPKPPEDAAPPPPPNKEPEPDPAPEPKPPPPKPVEGDEEAPPKREPGCCCCDCCPNNEELVPKPDEAPNAGAEDAPKPPKDVLAAGAAAPKPVEAAGAAAPKPVEAAGAAAPKPVLVVDPNNDDAAVLGAAEPKGDAPGADED